MELPKVAEYLQWLKDKGFEKQVLKAASLIMDSLS